ncbi:MAG: 16S rRNA (cytosine(1402)-N(4))-methyltransferase RsmH [Patescibacteria group bacterium]|nr:16S rRNA (cytosine(1402)-N(4))-methyltransferase RsmH [Patescibacteria group bacterium]
MKYSHTPVLLTEALDLLDLHAGDVVVDATLGLGGHGQEILKRIQPAGKLIGIDQDEEALKYARKILPDDNSVVLVGGNFRNLDELVKGAGYERVGRVLFDLGVSSLQLDDESRGFSFNKEAELDMRMDRRGSLTAKQVVNTYGYPELVRIFEEYGEERKAKEIAKRIVEARKLKPIVTTTDLVTVAFPEFRGQARGIHPATKIFQAIRIEVNDELAALQTGLEKGFKVLETGGRMAVISFHSLEDRIVKRFFKNLKTGGSGMLLTKKAVKPSWPERQRNKRSRSAKLRVIERIK